MRIYKKEIHCVIKIITFPHSNKECISSTKLIEYRVSQRLMLGPYDGNSDSCSIAGMFSDKYATLYNSVPYDNKEMKHIEAEVMTRLQKCNDDSYNITVHDIINAVTHLKTGKSDGPEGLSSDHFIHGNRKLYVLLSILFTLFYKTCF